MIERERKPWVGLATGAAVSLLAHAGVAWWLVRPAVAGESLTAPESPAKTPPQQPPPELGQISPSQAAIAWLGVERDPTEGEAPESEVDQAALSPLPGLESEPTPPPVPEQTVAQTETPPESAPVIEPTPDRVPEPIAATEPEPEPQPDTQPAELPSDPVQVEAPPPGPSLVAEPNPIEPEQEEPAAEQPEPQDQPEEIPAVEQTEAPSEQAVDPAPAENLGPPAPPNDRPVAPPAQTEPPKTQTPPTAPGEAAELSERQADAARKQAIDYDATNNRPLAASGLEITTVRPAWSVLVRQSFRPRDPVVLIRFGADGKVKRVDFLRETNGKKGTGIRAVDGPIIDAVYRWTAKGDRIDELDKNDPSSEIVISIRILLGGRRVP